jgi:hypothetical protein
MIVIALLLMAAAAALTVGIVVASTEPTQVDAYVATADTTVAGVFLAGLISGMVFLVGLVMFRAAVKRSARRRQERRALRREHERRVHDLELEKQRAEEERERLREQLSSGSTSESPPPRT